MAARDAPGRIDAARGLRGRLPSLFELDRPDGRARGPLFSLLVHQTVEAMPSWRAAEVVPEVMPIRVLASAIAALCALAMVVVMAPELRPAPPRVLVGDRRIDVSPADDTRDGAETLLVSPGTERPAPRSRGDRGREPGHGGRGRSARGRLDGAPITPELAPADARRRGELGGRRAACRRTPQRTASTPPRASTTPRRRRRSTTTLPPAREHRPTRRARRRGTRGGTSTEPGGGGPGEGAGTDTDPTLYGKPDDEPVTGRDRFELGIAARVRTRRGSDMGSWSEAPAADGDRHPVLASQHRAEQPGHRMPVPPAFAPLVSRLYAHTQPGEGDPR